MEGDHAVKIHAGKRGREVGQQHRAGHRMKGQVKDADQKRCHDGASTNAVGSAADAHAKAGSITAGMLKHTCWPLENFTDLLPLPFLQVFSFDCFWSRGLPGLVAISRMRLHATTSNTIPTNSLK